MDGNVLVGCGGKLGIRGRAARRAIIPNAPSGCPAAIVNIEAKFTGDDAADDNC